MDVFAAAYMDVFTAFPEKAHASEPPSLRM
jgi:hypothetical protein